MNHLSDAQLYSIVFDPVRPTSEETAHLAECTQCQAQLTALGRLANELVVARRSQPSAAALTNYSQLFASVRQQPSLLARAVQTLRATLTWDSRQQQALQGVRSGSADRYRQLYATERAEIEFFVTTRTAQRRDIEGELIAAQEAEALTPALVQLQGLSGQPANYETESDPQGRFRLTNVAPGRYQLLVTPYQGELLEIDELEIA
ncbi:MAG: carboxypeptidase-like regulatory domain-containing protein [Caldilineaceae bacterium]